MLNETFLQEKYDHDNMHHTCITPILANKHDKWAHIG